MLHGHLVVPTTDLNCHSVVLKPSFRFRLTSELADSCCQPEIGRDHCGSDSSAETFRTRNMHSTARGRISVESTSMGSVPVDQPLHDNGSRVEAWFSGVDWNPSACTDLVPDALDGFPLYWVREEKVLKAKPLKNLAPSDQIACRILAEAGGFDSATVISLEFNARTLEKYICENHCFRQLRPSSLSNCACLSSRCR